ncbi:MAG: VWA domain-containing protein [Eubacterium sp.]|nr:VWA domain-containing protein [Eubacterium sp.]
MKKVKNAVYLLFAVFVCLIGIAYGLSFKLPIKTAYAAGSAANNMNVVFVLDGSGSMYTTDKEKLRFEALELFLGLSTESGNYMGAVVFDDGIILKREIVPIQGRAAKNELSQEVKDAASNGDTDIGSAILTAVRMLKESGNPDLPSAMILLSDGNTDLPKDKSGKKLEESEHRKAAAIDYAREKEINIHSVCLNANGKARLEELLEISDATGGTCVEVKRAQDLKDVFNQFYNIIYSTKTTNLVDTKIPASGELKVPFSIPVIGVKEANIIINTLNADTSYSLFSPKGYGYTRAELDDMAIRAKTFTVIKIEHPQPGDWELVVRGARRDQVKIDMVYNTDLSMLLEAAETQSEGQKASWELSAQVWNEGAAVSDAEVYQKYPFWITVTDKASGETEKLDMSADAESSLGQYETEGYGKYKVQAFCEIDGIRVKSNAVTLQKTNTAPVWTQDPVVVDKKIHLFSASLLKLDLNAYASDAEDGDSGLHFQIVDSAFAQDDVYLEDDAELNIKIKKCGNGELTVAATDEAGAVTQVQVQIHTASITGYLLLAAVLLVLLAALIVLFPVLRSYATVVRGTVQVLTYGEEGTDPPVTFDGDKGRMVLSRYVHPSQDVGLLLEKCYINAGEKKDCIYFVSAEGVYSDQGGGQKKKKVCVRAGMEVNISSDMDFANGIRISYMPY